MKRWGLGTRIAALCVSIAVLTVILAAALTAGFVRNDGTAAARTNLAHLADVAQSLVARTPKTRPTETRIRALFTGLNVRSGVIAPTGAITADAPLIKQSLTQAQIATVLGGQSLSIQKSVGGDDVFLRSVAPKYWYQQQLHARWHVLRDAQWFWYALILETALLIHHRH